MKFLWTLTSEKGATMLSKGAPAVAATYNASAKDRNFTPTHSRSIGFVSSHRRCNVSLCNSSPTRVTPLMAVTTGEQSGSVPSSHDSKMEKSLGNQLRLGGMSEDGLSYKENFIIRSYEVRMNKTVNIETIANLLQEAGGNHPQSVGYSTDGFGTTTAMRKSHLIWVILRMHIEVYRYPTWSDVIEIETWGQLDGKVAPRREWILKDYANGQVIGRATSKWGMINEDTRKMQKLTEDIENEFLLYCPKTPRLAFPEKNNKSLKKVAKVKDPAEYSRLGLVPRRSDLDMNKHINNVTYIGWALESIPDAIIDTHELQTITLDYRRECQQDDLVDSLTSHEPFDEQFTESNGSVRFEKNGQDLTRFLHLLRSSGTGLEISRCRTEWRKKSQKL